MCKLRKRDCIVLHVGPIFQAKLSRLLSSSSVLRARSLYAVSSAALQMFRSGEFAVAEVLWV